MRRRIDCTGGVFGRLFVLGYSHKKDEGNIHYWKCLCRCGKEAVVNTGGLMSGGTQSCGCLRKGRRPARSRVDRSTSCLRRTWRGMRRRCENPKDGSFCRYGGRGIKVCKRWQAFENFLADMGSTYEIGLSIDRIDPKGNYEKKNCQWLTVAENRRKALDDNGGVTANSIKILCVETGERFLSVRRASRAFNICESYLRRKLESGGAAKGMHFRRI